MYISYILLGSLLTNSHTMKSLDPVAMCVNTVEDCLPISTGSHAALRAWEVGALTPILWYTMPWLSTAHTLRVPQLIDVNTVSPENQYTHDVCNSMFSCYQETFQTYFSRMLHMIFSFFIGFKLYTVHLLLYQRVISKAE